MRAHEHTHAHAHTQRHFVIPKCTVSFTNDVILMQITLIKAIVHSKQKILSSFKLFQIWLNFFDNLMNTWLGEFNTMVARNDSSNCTRRLVGNAQIIQGIFHPKNENSDINYTLMSFHSFIFRTQIKISFFPCIDSNATDKAQKGSTLIL